MSGNTKEKKSISELLDSLCSKNLRGPFLKALAESVGSSPSGAQKYFIKHGHLPAPTVSDITKLMLTSPEISKAVEMSTAAGNPSLIAEAAAQTATRLEVASILSGPGTLMSPNIEPPKKRKKRNKKKKKNGNLLADTDNRAMSASSGVLRPRNFLEAALYFSSITMSTVEMATELEPENFFAPPLLFSIGPMVPFECERWQRSLRRPNCSALEWEQLKAQQKRVVCLFAVALLQSHSSNLPNMKVFGGSGVDKLASATTTVRSNYLKRSIGLYAISLVDHLPPTLTTPSPTSPQTSSSILSHFAPQHGASPILLANRKVDLNDLKVPNAPQLTAFWEGLRPEEQLAILQGEMNNLQKGWLNLRKAWCLCKYCRTRNLRLVDAYELFYRAYYDDLERKAASLICSPVGEPTLKAKSRRHLYRQLSELADDIVEERGYHYQMVMRRLGKAFEEDYDWGDCDHGDETCEACRRRYGRDSIPTNNCSVDDLNACHHHNHHTINHGERDDLDDDEDDDFSADDWDDVEFDIFYEDFNLMEDEEIIQAENDLPIDPAHLATSFPHLYDPRLYTMPRPAIPAYHHHGSEMERQSDGQSLYELLCSLLFQFHLVPHYLEAEALARQRRLLAEEEELERQEQERAEQKQKAKQRKKEKQKAKRSAAVAIVAVAQEEEEEVKPQVDIINEETITKENIHKDIIHKSVDDIPLNIEQNEEEIDGGIENQAELQIQQDLDDVEPNQTLKSPITNVTLEVDEDEPPGLSPALTSPSSPPQTTNNQHHTWIDRILGTASPGGVLTETFWRPIALQASHGEFPSSSSKSVLSDLTIGDENLMASASPASLMWTPFSSTIS